jgi:hypothetical protein
MATVDLTLDQIVAAVRQLPEGQRRALLLDIENETIPEQALLAARRFRDRFSLGEKKRKRMSTLLARSNAGVISPSERKELDRLVDEFEQKTLELAQAITGTVNSSHPKRRSRAHSAEH